MQKIVGILCLLAGVALLLWARKLADHFGPQVQELFAGAPTDRAVYFRIGGGVLVILGLAQCVWPAKKDDHP